MPIRLSTTEALQELELLLTLDNDPGFQYPAFCIETEFIDFFVEIIEQNQRQNNMVAFMGTFINKAFELSIDGIFDILDEYNISGAEIFSLMCEKKLIRNREKRKLHKKLPQKVQSIVGTHINAYNNWLLAAILWKAYVLSHDPGFSVNIPEEEDSEAPVESFNDPVYRPLWAMKQACLEAGDPTHGSGKEDIFIRPSRKWFKFNEQKHHVSKSRTIA